mgnify:CR=1 FL=1
MKPSDEACRTLDRTRPERARRRRSGRSTTLGTATSSSIRNPSGSDTREGSSSARQMAARRPSGRAIAMRDPGRSERAVDERQRPERQRHRIPRRRSKGRTSRTSRATARRDAVQRRHATSSVIPMTPSAKSRVQPREQRDRAWANRRSGVRRAATGGHDRDRRGESAMRHAASPDVARGHGAPASHLADRLLLHLGDGLRAAARSRAAS